MTTTARAVAAAIRQRQPEVPVLKLHKLLYYAQGHHLAATDKTLFSDTVSAWDMGPVVGTLWRAERDGLDETTEHELSESELNTIGYVLHRYGGMTGRDLVRLSHAEDPWREADENRPPGGRVTISVAALRSFFVTLREEDLEDDGTQLRAAWVSALVAGAEERRGRETTVDSIDDIRRQMQSLRR